MHHGVGEENDLGWMKEQFIQEENLKIQCKNT
jgi:hypothetical protein